MAKRLLWLCVGLVVVSELGIAQQSSSAEASILLLQEQIRTARQTAQNLTLPPAVARQVVIDAATLNLTPYLMGDSYRLVLSELEQSRWNKQTGTTSSSAGSTSVVSKGSVPALLGFAVENGALTRSLSGTVVTFTGSPANILSALAKGGYLQAGPAVPALDGSFEAIAKRVSFHVSFDTSKGNTNSAANTLTGDKQQLAEWGTRFEIVNKRDPRRSEYRQEWQALMNTEGKIYIDRLAPFEVALKETAEYRAWATAVGEKVFNATDATLPAVLREAYDTFQTVIQKLATADPTFEPTRQQVISAAADFASTRANTINRIMKSWTAAFEYNFVKQANTNGAVTAGAAPAAGAPATTPSAALPDLGSINFVASKGFTDGPEFTFNAGMTWFQSKPAGLQVGSVRDVRVAAQLDIPLKAIQNIGKPTLTFSGLFLALLEEPLGAKVVVNTVSVSTKGNIGLAQAKLTVPTKNAGVSIPISITWANRTELIKEKEVRANFGLSFDLDKLFAKP